MHILGRLLCALSLIVLSAFSLASPVWPRDSAIHIQPHKTGHTPLRETSPDAVIGKTLQYIRSNQLDEALREVDQVIAMQPDFKLAHLIKGDLLMARARPLQGIGNITGKATDKRALSDLQEEARVRLLGYVEQPDANQLPRQILQLAPEQQYALLADTSRSRLYLFENVSGEPRLKRHFYMTIGKNGTDKRVEGDGRTPTGVYRIIKQLPRSQLTDLYGNGAFPLDYPNAWDQSMGRSGHGIWLHGVPSDTYSRPPRSSDGCLVIANPDLTELSQWIQVGITPIVIVDRAEWVDRGAWERSRNELVTRLNQWQSDWQARDANRFLDHYSQEFLQGAGKGWSESKKRNIQNKAWIQLELHDISLFLYPGGDMAYAEFNQYYSSDKFRSSAHKQIYWNQQHGHWRITLEKSAEIPSSRYASR